MSHLEDVVAQYYDWQGFLVKRNIKVGRLSHGGWEGELDVVAYHPHSERLVHIEPSIDAHSWSRREERFIKKFQAGKKYIFRDVFTWLDRDTPIEQIALLISHPKDHGTLAGGKVQSIDEFFAEVRDKISGEGIVAKRAIPEQYGHLRTMQLSHNGYHKVL